MGSSDRHQIDQLVQDGYAVIGLALMAIGLGSIAWAQTFIALLACIIVFSIGNLIALANQNRVIANMARPEARGSYFA